MSQESRSGPDLLPCPFCGSDDIDAEFALVAGPGGNPATHHEPGCMACGATAPANLWNKAPRSENTRQEAVTPASSERAQEPPVHTRIERQEDGSARLVAWQPTDVELAEEKGMQEVAKRIRTLMSTEIGEMENAVQDTEASGRPAAHLYGAWQNLKRAIIAPSATSPSKDAARFQWLCDAAGREWEALFGAQMTGLLREEIDARMARSDRADVTK